MPFKSKAQRRKFAHLLVEGKISDETYEEWNRSSGRKELPERVTPKKAKAKKKATKKKATKKPTTRKPTRTRRIKKKAKARRRSR